MILYKKNGEKHMANEKAKPTLQEKLEKRKFRSPGKAVTFLYNLIGSTVLLPNYAPHITKNADITKRDGPCFLIWNHLSRLDHLYTMKAAYPARYNMVAGYSEFFRAHLYTVFRLNQILPKKVFTNDRLGIKAINAIIKQGGIVTFSPEGMSSIYGVNQPVVPGSGHFLKHYKIPVYYLKLRGQYLTSTKHYLEERKGRTEAELSLLFTPEQLSEMTAEEIENKLNETFRHDDYEWGQKNHIKWEMHGRSAEHLDEICYRCPRCGEDLVMRAEGSKIRCSKCGNGAVVNDYYEFEPFDDKCVLPVSPSKWVEQERAAVIDEIRADPGFSFTEDVVLGYLPPYKYVPKSVTSVDCGQGRITFDHKGIHYKGTRHGQEWSFDLGYSVVYSLIIMTSTAQFSLYVNGQFYEFKPARRSVGKMLLITEEMHRYHYNTWKNLPWYDYMYEGKALGIDNQNNKG